MRAPTCAWELSALPTHLYYLWLLLQHALPNQLLQHCVYVVKVLDVCCCVCVQLLQLLHVVLSALRNFCCSVFHLLDHFAGHGCLVCRTCSTHAHRRVLPVACVQATHVCPIRTHMVIMTDCYDMYQLDASHAHRVNTPAVSSCLVSMFQLLVP